MKNKKIIYILKYDREHGVFFLALFISYVCIASFTETVMPVASPANSVICTLYALMMPHYYYNYMVSEQKKLKLAEAYTDESEISEKVPLNDKITTEGLEVINEQ